MRQDPATFLNQDILRLARDGISRNRLIRQMAHQNDWWPDETKERMDKLIAEGRLVEVKAGWVQTVPGKTRSRSGIKFEPYQRKTGRSSGE